ncbi:hypothetical protein, partial [Microbacterium sp. O]|uniref:hypothetical protein n=1 Tax=Microbacterium sp. O TaxID=2502250 RepID=UPI001BB17E01
MRRENFTGVSSLPGAFRSLVDMRHSFPVRGGAGLDGAGVRGWGAEGGGGVFDGAAPPPPACPSAPLAAVSAWPATALPALGPASAAPLA